MAAITSRELDIILDSTHDGMIAVDRAGIVTLFNRAAERITGLRSEAVLGRPARDVIPNTRLHIVLSEGKPELNQEQRLKDVVILTNRVPVRDERGAIIGAVAVFRDVTEMRVLTDKVTGLWNLRSLLEAVIESTADAISVADEKGNNLNREPGLYADHGPHPGAGAEQVRDRGHRRRREHAFAGTAHRQARAQRSYESGAGKKRSDRERGAYLCG